jgi:hypothetical protein
MGNMGGLSKSFPDCPYHCSNGELFDRKAHKLYPCPYCEEQRKKIAKGATTDVEVIDEKTGRKTTVQQTLAEMLGVKKTISTKFVWEAVIQDFEKKYITEDSLDFLKSNLEEVYDHIVMGRVPEKSYVFGLGFKGNPEFVVYPLLARAYMEGLTICKPLSTFDILHRTVCEDTFEKEMTADILFISLPDDGNRTHLKVARTIMTGRAGKQLPTFFITTGEVSLYTSLYSQYGFSSLNSATAVFVRQKLTIDDESAYTKGSLPPDSYKPTEKTVIPNAVKRSETGAVKNYLTVDSITEKEIRQSRRTYKASSIFDDGLE